MFESLYSERKKKSSKKEKKMSKFMLFFLNWKTPVCTSKSPRPLQVLSDFVSRDSDN